MDVFNATERVMVPYARWILRHPVLASIQTLTLAVGLLAIGAFVFHSRLVIIIAFVSIGFTLLSFAPRLWVLYRTHSSASTHEIERKSKGD
jgi:hypothetical protein